MCPRAPPIWPETNLTSAKGTEGNNARDRSFVLTYTTSREKTPGDGTTDTQCIEPLPRPPVGGARREGIDGVTYKTPISRTHNHLSGGQRT